METRDCSSKKGIQNSSLRWFGHVVQMGDERTPKKRLHTKMEEKQPRATWIDQNRKDIKLRGEYWE